MKKDRFGIVIFFFLFFMALLEVRLVNITLFPDQRFKNTRLDKVSRGTIYDSLGRELAVSSDVYSLYARPNIMANQLKTAVKNYLLQYNLATDADTQALNQDKSFIWIRRKMNRQNMETVRGMIDSLKKSGWVGRDELGIVPEEGRYYRFTAASSAVGAVGMDNQGLAGLEHSLNSYLSKGDNVYTTLDGDLCTILSEELMKSVKLNEAESASAVLLSVKGRKILALASVPGFDPNDQRNMKPEDMKSRTTSFIFEPGSVMKQFSAAFALENNLVSPHSPVYTCSGEADIDDHAFTCEVPHGKVDLARIIQKSCNVGMVQVADKFNREQFRDFLLSFGFGKPVPIPLIDNESGILRPLVRWSGLSKYMISIGQEIGVTTVQLSQASGVIADGGIYRPAVLVERIEDQDKTNVYNPPSNEARVISAATAQQLLSMMETVVSENGTAISARIEGISIAGKTGTGQIARENTSGYYPDLYNAVFLGYFPSEAPEYTLVVVINKPRAGAHTGGAVAAPVFADILRRMIVSTGYLTNH